MSMPYEIGQRVLVNTNTRGRQPGTIKRISTVTVQEDWGPVTHTGLLVALDLGLDYLAHPDNVAPTPVGPEPAAVSL